MDAHRFMTETLRTSPWGEVVAAILSAAVKAVDPYQAVLRHLKREGDTLVVGRERYSPDAYEHIYVVGAGKAGLPMAQAVVDVIGERITAGKVTVKEGHTGGYEAVGKVRIVEAGHPLPDERGVESTRDILSILENTTEEDLVICLISGGGSALLTSPVEGISLEDLRVITDLLLASGGTITELNTLRTGLDRVKGGGLAAAAAPAQILTLILSDVVGDPLEVIASGPTVPRVWSPDEALAVIDKYGLAPQLPPSILPALRNSSRITLDRDLRVNNVIIANVETAARAALAQAEESGFHTFLLTTMLEGEAWEVGLALAGTLREMAKTGMPVNRPGLVVLGGETTVTLRGKGSGGRNQEMALAAVEPLSGVGNAAIITLATDGGDGPTDAAGAVVTGETLERARKMNLAQAAYLENNDSYTFFTQLGDALITGPTQTNVNDLVLLFVF
jgi:hydroxypyruvate reductase